MDAEHPFRSNGGRSRQAGPILSFGLWPGFMTVLLVVLTVVLSQAQIEKAEADLSAPHIRLLEHAQGALQDALAPARHQVRALVERDPAVASALEAPTRTAIERLAIVFRSAMLQNADALQLRWLDDSGQELLRFDQDAAGHIVRVPADQLQNKASRPYVTAIERLPRGAVHVSAIDLNVENEQVQTPHVPTVRIGARLFTASGEPRGIVIVNIRMARFIDLFRTLGPGDGAYLINDAGYWLSTPDRQHEWGFMFGRDDTVRSRYPTAWAAMASESLGHLDAPEGLWDWVTIAPAGTEGPILKAAALVSRAQLDALARGIWQRNGAALAGVLLLAGLGFYRFWQSEQGRRQAEAARAEGARALGAQTVALERKNQALVSEVEARKRIEADLESSLGALRVANEDIAGREAELREMLESAPVAVRVARLSDNTLQFINHKYAELIGIEASEAASFDISALYADPSDFQRIRAGLETRGHAFETLLEIKDPLRPERPNYWVLGSYMVIDYEGAQSVLAWLVDVTQLKNAQDSAQRANEAKSRFLANMSHEIRTPLNAIIGMAYLLGFTQLSQDQRHQLDTIHASGKNLIELLNAILDLSKIEAGEFVLDCAPFSPKVLLDEVGIILGATARTKGVRLVVDSDGEALPESVAGDAARLRQVLINLVGNALKFTDGGGTVTLSLKLSEAPVEPGLWKLRFEVRDTGIGIAQEDQGRLFEPFVQADAGTTRRHGGTGLGLSIVKQVTELMGGNIAFESRLGEGSRFWLELPFLTTVETPAQKPIGGGSKRLRVLVADDNAADREILRGFGERFGWDMEAVASGREAIGLILQRINDGHPFDSIVLDWRMPDMDGLQVLRHLTDTLHTKLAPAVIVITGEDVADLQTHQEAGLADSVLTKPVDPSAFFNTVSEAALTRGRGTGHILDATYLDTEEYVWLTGVRALVVDDSDINLEVCCRILEQEGATATGVSSGRAALAQFEHGQRFDVVLMDVQMPDMDGNEATRRMRAELGLVSLPVIALTAGATQEDQQAALDAGMTAFIGKPINPRALIRVVRQHYELYRGKLLPVLPRGGASPAGQHASFPAVRGIDTADAEARLSHDRAFFMAMLERFVHAHVDGVERLRGWVAEGSTRLAKDYLHRLRGQAGMIGAKQIVGASARLEDALNAEQAGTEALIDALDAAMCELLEGAKSVLDVRPDHEAGALECKVDITDVLDRLDALAGAVASNDLVSLELDAELLTLLKGSAIEAAYASVSSAIQEVKFASAAREIARLKEALRVVEDAPGA